MKQTKLTPIEKLNIMVDGLTDLLFSMIEADKEVGHLLNPEGRKEAAHIKMCVGETRNILIEYLQKAIENEAEMN